MKRIVVLLVAILGGSGTFAAETPKAPALSAADREFFERKVRPLLSEHCYGCHSQNAKKVRSGLQLDSRARVLQGGDRGPAVVPGQPDNSLLIQAVRGNSPALARFTSMPPKGKLSERDIALLTEWVLRGAPFPEAGAAVTTRSIDLTQGRKFWSFQPLRTNPPPTVRDSSWPSRRIDRFLLAEMEKRGLKPAPAADRRTLIRRATFDLIGLPPTPEEVEAFVADQRPDAYERLIDHLLASPHHGERWGRYWLDLARYCDIAEPWATTKGKPHFYRDWVIRAVNEDVPYDRFVVLQLAADQMPGARPEDRAALGFLALSPTYWKELKLDRDVIKTVVAEEWEERIHTLGSTFLGLTVACARCHDHKFDPITQKDYYALAGVFASIREVDRPLAANVDAAKVRQASADIENLQKQIDKLRGKKPVPDEAERQVRELEARIATIRRTTAHLDAPLAPCVEDTSLVVLADGPHRTRLEYRPGVAQDVPLQVRGNPASPGPAVPRRFLSVLSSGEPAPFRQGSGRLELAKAIVHEGGPLAARVIVNRVWEHHFGRGLVDTPSNFGTEGARPSHPALLDDLAARFVAAGWSLKWLHREIMLSSAYRQVSRAGQTTDPDNRWLSRMNRQRLDVEAWRDAMLAVTGSLDHCIGGPSLDLGSADNRRRTLYGTIKRRELHDLLRLHDFPDPTTHSASRTPTTTPLQQLFILNSPFLQQQSAALARRLQAEATDTEARVRRAYQLLFARPATDAEVKLAIEFLTPANDALWQEYSQVLLGSNEFLFVD